MNRKLIVQRIEPYKGFLLHMHINITMTDMCEDKLCSKDEFLFHGLQNV